MTRISSLAFALLIITAFGLQSASAQFPIKLPEIPGSKKPKADPPRSAGGQSESAPAPAPAPTAGPSAAGPDQPTIAKDSIQVTAFTNSSYRGNYDMWSCAVREKNAFKTSSWDKAVEEKFYALKTDFDSTFK